MAILRNMWLRGAKQKIAGSVVYQLKGQTVQREQAASVANPRTGAQMSQRLKLANLVAMYRANRAWMKIGAFENKLKTFSDYNAFVSANINANSVTLTKEQAAMGACVLAPYIVTKGTLPGINVSYVNDLETFATDIYISSRLTIDKNTTVADFSTEVLQNNNGLREGDQLLFVICSQTNKNGVPYVNTRYYEIILNSNDSTTLDSLGLNGVIVEDLYAGNTLITFVANNSMSACTVVLSREVSGKVHVSTQSLVLSPSATTFNATFTTSAARANARASYGASDNYVLNTNYAGDSNPNVPLAQEIMLANGRAAGQVLSVDIEQGTQGKVLENIVLTMAQDLQGTDYEGYVKVRFPGESSDRNITIQTVNQSGNIATMVGGAVGDTTATVVRVTEISLVGPSGQFTISFQNPSDDEWGEVTE